MKFFSNWILCFGFALMAYSCTNTHLINDEQERLTVQSDFENRVAKYSEGNLFDVFNQPMTELQKEAMTFLYAYMPLGDITDYSGEFFLENIDYTLKAKEEMPWGKLIPEREFRHFVLPIRVNNENLDDSRKVFYEELKDRVKNLSLHDAVLEVNHWCHEKVVYTPSDSRTSSPLASVKTAYGRCGEESTFTVAALRAVGIPARQVYTPRWAHTDDNHAWVEAWVDGKWYFFGACEPEPVLDYGWFNAPASRGMLMHTKVFGRYNGPEEIMHQNSKYTEINIIGMTTLEMEPELEKFIDDAFLSGLKYEYLRVIGLKSDVQLVAVTESFEAYLFVASVGKKSFDFADLILADKGELFYLVKIRIDSRNHHIAVGESCRKNEWLGIVGVIDGKRAKL